MDNDEAANILTSSPVIRGFIRRGGAGKGARDSGSPVSSGRFSWRQAGFPTHLREDRGPVGLTESQKLGGGCLQ